MKTRVVGANKQWVEDYDVAVRQIEQGEADYVSISAKLTDGQACASCQWFVAPNACVLVAGEISPTGLSRMYMEKKPYEVEPMPVRIVDEEKATRVGNLTLLGTKKSFLDSLRGLVGLGKQPSPIVFTRQKDGRVRYFAQTSNNLEDREGELLTQAAHEEFVGWVQKTKQYPELLAWHAVGARLGVDDWIDMCGGVRCDSGLIDEGKEYLVDSLVGLGVDLGVSHRYIGVEDHEKAMTWYRGWELSVLPKAAAANIWNGMEGMAMGFNAAQKQFLVQLYGDAELVNSFEKATDELSASLTSLGIRQKDVAAEGGAGEVAATDGPLTDPSATAITSQVADPAIMSALTDLTGAVQGLTQVVTAQQKAIAALQQDDDSKVAATLESALAGRGKGFDASASADNVVVTEKAKADDDWFGKQVVEPAARMMQVG